MKPSKHSQNSISSSFSPSLSSHTLTSRLSGSSLFAILLVSALILGCKGEHGAHKMGEAHSGDGHHMAQMKDHDPAQHNATTMPDVGSQHRLQAGSATLDIQNAWVRPTVTGQMATGAFMRITASENLTLRSASSSVAHVTEVHEMAMENDVMKMRELAQGLPLPKGETVQLAPGGYHIMLMDLKAPIQNGDTVALELELVDSQGKAQKVSFSAPAVMPSKP